MAIADGMLGVAISGLQASQRSLGIAGHNISNANTEGFSRQRGELVTRHPQYTGAGYVGKGVKINTTERVYDDFITQQIRVRTAGFNKENAYHDFAIQVDNLLADPQLSITVALGGFFDALQVVADDPTRIPARQVMIVEGETLVDRFHTLHERLSQLDRDINTRMRGVVSDINALAEAISDMNYQISTQGNSRQEPNDLLDQRDQMMKQLSELVGVTTVPQDDGSVNVFAGKGQPLVLGINSYQITTTTNDYDVSKLEIAYLEGGVPVNITRFITGGELGGLLDFRTNILEETQNQLGMTAVAFSQIFNTQHQKGYTLNGTFQQDYFVTPQGDAQQNVNNTSAAVLDVTITNLSQLTNEDYYLDFDGANYNVRRVADSSLVTSGAALPLTFDGVTVDYAGASPPMIAGDAFLIRPTRSASRDIDTLFSDPRLIAAASPIRTLEDVANTGTGAISQGKVVTIGPTITNPYYINITNNTGATFDYEIFNGPPGVTTGVTGTLNIPLGGTIAFNGWEVELTGDPQIGDNFYIQENVGGYSDNRNALDLVASRAQKALYGGSASVEDGYTQLVADIGTKTRQAEINQDAQLALLNQSIEIRESISGVNLDEEAANLIRFQQAYAANAQVIATADSIFQTLLHATGR